MRIGILGGTFDPIHIGHLALAEVARVRLGLDKVLFVVAGNPYFKKDRCITETLHRVKMVRLAIQGNPYFDLSTLEVERPGPSYAVDTVAELRRASGDEDEFFFIMGWDNLLELPRWYKPAELVSMCHLIAIPRVGCPVPDPESLEEEVPGLSSKVTILSEPLINVTATLIRERVARALPIHHLVPERVLEYIARNSLYKKSKALKLLA